MKQPGASSHQGATVETQAPGTNLAPGGRPGLPQMVVVMMPARHSPTTGERGSGNSTINGG